MSQVWRCGSVFGVIRDAMRLSLMVMSSFTEGTQNDGE